VSRGHEGEPRPSEICAHLLRAMEASEGRRRKRKRDTTPDAAGLEIKRWLLAEVARCDPDPEGFEAWLLELITQGREDSAEGENDSLGARLAMARSILEEWQLACTSSGFRNWLSAGAPSEDR
jgi:hypothetical protein